MNIRQLFLTYEDSLKHYMYSVTPSKEMVEDSYQDAYIKLDKYLKAGKDFYGNEASIKSMFKLMVRNIILDKMRKKSRSKEVTTDITFNMVDLRQPDDDIIEMEESLDDDYINKMLKNAFKNMSHDIYMVYKLRNKGFMFKDIAYIMDCGINTTLQRMRYAKRHIEREFKNNTQN